MRGTALIVDDAPAFREAAAVVLSAAGYRVVGEAADAASALRAIRDLAPTLVLLDVRLPDASGLDVARTVVSQRNAPIVILTSSADYSRVYAATGARAFLAKHELTPEAIIEAACS